MSPMPHHHPCTKGRVRATSSAPALTTALAIASLVSLGPGCTKWQREPSFFADELTALLEQRSEAIEACYDRYVEGVDPAARGLVVLGFEVERDTGALVELRVDPAKTTAPEALAACVTAGIADLELEPPDVNTGEATVTWEFVLGSRKAPAADPFADAQQGVLGCYSTYLAAVDRQARGALIVDYAFDAATGSVSRLEVVGDGTTAPMPVVECAAAVLESASIDPAKLDARNTAGRRIFTLAFTPAAD